MKKKGEKKMRINKQEISGLSGESKICGRCKKECKQWQQVEVLACPSYKRTMQLTNIKRGE